MVVLVSAFKRKSLDIPGGNSRFICISVKGPGAEFFLFISETFESCVYERMISQGVWNVLSLQPWSRVEA